MSPISRPRPSPPRQSGRSPRLSLPPWLSFESGYGLTRLAIKSNNIYAFKWPGATIAHGHDKYILACQPDWDKGNAYVAFTSRADAINFVAWRLAESPIYKAATVTYQKDLAAGIDRKIAAGHWLKAVAAHYNYKPNQYEIDVSKAAADPIGDSSDTLWRLKP